MTSYKCTELLLAWLLTTVIGLVPAIAKMVAWAGRPIRNLFWSKCFSFSELTVLFIRSFFKGLKTGRKDTNTDKLRLWLQWHGFCLLRCFPSWYTMVIVLTNVLVCLHTFRPIHQCLCAHPQKVTIIRLCLHVGLLPSYFELNKVLVMA